MLSIAKLNQYYGGSHILRNVEFDVPDGKCTTLTGLSEFVSNLEASGYFKRSVEIVSTASDAPTSTAGNELIRFTIKAVFQVPGETAPAAAPAKAGN